MAEYAKCIDQTAAATDAVVASRDAMGTAAERYATACETLLSAQETELDREIDASLPPAKLKERVCRELVTMAESMTRDSKNS